MKQDGARTTIRRANQRGRTRLDWLHSQHSFSFGDYHDPDHMGFGVLRVINEDMVQGGKGFGVHGHRDMEIISYVLDGALAHKDSLGTGSVIRPGDVQRMSAGTGIRHSEFNASQDSPVHFLQIWIVPAQGGLPPTYEQKSFVGDARRNRWCLVGSQDGRDGSVTIHQDVDMYCAVLEAGCSLRHGLDEGRRAWLQIARGALDCNGATLTAGDGMALARGRALELTADTDAEVLLFDLPD